ncbi:RNA-binding protein [Bartonella sp. LJL80]
MANKAVFKKYFGKWLAGTDGRNMESAPSYQLSAYDALAQLAETGTFNNTFYGTGEMQLAKVLELSAQVDPEFLAKVAVYAARQGHMKDMPATLLAVLSSLDHALFTRAFPHVIKNGKMLRNFVQLMRSGAAGRKSLGTRPKKMVQNWLERASVQQLLNASVGNDPSLADVVKMVHPKPQDEERKAFYAWLLRKPYDVAALPELVAQFEAFKRDHTLAVPNVPFQMLTTLPLEAVQWAQVAKRVSWQTLRQNLNMFARKGVFDVAGMGFVVAERLRDADEIRRAKVFPYQLLMAWKMADVQVPPEVRDALQDAMEVSLQNVPSFKGRMVLCPDVSGSMSSAITGYRKGATSAVRCVDVAGLITAAFLRRNPHATVLPFENEVVNLDLNGRDSVMTNAQKLANVCGGGTNCSAPLKKLANRNEKVDLVFFISDNQSWVDANQFGRPTEMMLQWRRIKKRNPQAKMVCLDIQPYTDTPALNGDDVLNIGGFSDAVFDLVNEFATRKEGKVNWMEMIEKTEL